MVAAWIPTDGVYDFSFSSHSTAFPVLNSANSELQQKVNRWSLPEVKAYLQMQVHNAMHKYLFSLRTFTSSYVLESFGVWFFCFFFFFLKEEKERTKIPSSSSFSTWSKSSNTPFVCSGPWKLPGTVKGWGMKEVFCD